MYTYYIYLHIYIHSEVTLSQRTPLKHTNKLTNEYTQTLLNTYLRVKAHLLKQAFFMIYCRTC